ESGVALASSTIAGHARSDRGTRNPLVTHPAAGGDSMTASSEKLQARAKAIRSRAAIRAWEIRQHGHARGVWFAIERLFALTSRAWVLSEADEQKLIAAGRRPD